MYQNKSILAIIPARSGSKEIPDKNIKPLSHKPLMAYTIEACLNSNLFDDIIVSTDSPQYRQIAKKYGASVPFLRPLELAADQTSTTEVILHVLRRMQQSGKCFDYFMLLQPTSPLRREKHITESIQILFQNHADSVISICEVEHPSFLNVQLSTTGHMVTNLSHTKQFRRQDQEKEYRINGAIYLASVRFFLKNQNFYSEKTYPYLMNALDSIDIDNEFQFKLAEYIIQNKYLN